MNAKANAKIVDNSSERLPLGPDNLRFIGLIRDIKKQAKRMERAGNELARKYAK